VSCFIPPYLLREIARHRPEEAAWVEQMLAHDDAVRLQRTTVAATAATGAAWVVHTARNGSTLPGDVVRSAGDGPSGDAAVDEAADGVAASLAMYREVYDRDSYDDRGATVIATVHYQRGYDNAFWNGRQLVFGDGDGRTFDRFTKPVDVLGHELTHAVTERTAGLVYEGQSGALNESVSDVFGSCVKQRLLGQDALAADWLIGAGLFLPGVQGRALRDMAHPGTAYDDPVLGKDPQPAHMDDYVDTTDDNGGVHINSGIPNRAFQLAAVAIGGSSAEGAGRIWYAALTGGLSSQADFAAFAAATVAAAGVRASPRPRRGRGP
jgi:Zn-dependent metalloprotease